MKRISLTQIIRRRWMILVTVAVVALAGFAVDRLHDAFSANKHAANGSGASNEIVEVRQTVRVYRQAVGNQPGHTHQNNHQNLPMTEAICPSDIAHPHKDERKNRQ